MGAQLLSVDEFVETYNAIGPREMARKLDTNYNSILNRANRLRKKGLKLESKFGPAHSGTTIPTPRASHRIDLELRNGIVLVASDAHYWPGETSLMHKALVTLCKELRPQVLILNGDVMDLPRASRHAAIGWEKRPEIHEEIEWAQTCLHEIALALPMNCRKIWSIGNHDARYETRLANIAPEYAKIHGVHLKDSFPLWEPCWSTFINANVLVKHRFRGGIHAVHNNLLWSGVNIVTGHLHSAQVRALTLYDEKTIWGMDTGCLAEPSARTFIDYTEDNPKNWRSGFGVLTFKNGRLMMPELCLKWDSQHVQFRGAIIKP